MTTNPVRAHLLQLVEHLAWADDRARAQLASMPAGSSELARATTIYAHLAAAEHIWVSRLHGRAPAHPVWPSIDPGQATAVARAAVDDLRRFVADATDETLHASITYHNSVGAGFANRIGDIVLHVAMHGAYHRGQLALLARLAGGQPAATDFIFYLRDGASA